MTYKLSKYNYFYKKDEDSIIGMNLINKIIFGLDKEKYELINNKPINFELIKKEKPFFFSALEKLGVIIDNDIDEKNFLVYEHRKQIFSKRYFRLTILPTLECNFNCWYCYEEKPSGRMTDEIKKNIIKFIKNNIDYSNIKHFQLDWFGGEPLVCFDDVIYPISLKAKNWCMKKGLEFSNVITTNGALMSPEMIAKFKKIGLNQFQITLDGHEDSHNKVKKSENGENIYKKTIRNILTIIDTLEKPHVMLRLNYTPKNVNELIRIIDDIPEQYRNKIEISLQQVWQTDKVDLSEIILSHNKRFSDAGFIAPLYKLEGKCYRCYADLESQLVLNYDGKAFKCTARDFINHEPEGFLQNDGFVKWNDIFYKRMSCTTIENEKCMGCEVLPACWGPCSQKVIECEEGAFDKICNKLGIENTIKILMDKFYDSNILLLKN